MAQVRGRKNLVFVRLKPRDRESVLSLIQKGKVSGRVLKRALVLKLMDQGGASPQVAQTIGMTAKSARNIVQKYHDGGLAVALNDLPRSGQPRKMNEKEASRIIAMVCASPPEGYARWSVRLIVEEVIRKKVVDWTNRESIRLLLKNHDLKPWLKKNVVHGGVNA